MLLLKVLIKGSHQSSGREDYVKEAEKQLGVRHFYEEDLNDPEPLISIIHIVLQNTRKIRALKMENIQYFEVKNPKFARFCLLPKIHKRLREQLADLSFPHF